jgi:outer membrane protein OmpA-like peptidoglycan-associated protein
VKRLALAACGLTLSACTTSLTTTLAAAVPVSLVGQPARSVALPALEAELQRLQGQLGQQLTSRDWGIPAQLSRGAEPVLRLRLGADESFDAGGAQLQPAALDLYARIGAVLKDAPVVTHVLVHGEREAAELPIDLTARRAASVANYLLATGLPAGRVRAEGRGAREPATAEAQAASVNRRVELVVKPVIAGSEADAWLAPAPTGCAGCLPHG